MPRRTPSRSLNGDLILTLGRVDGKLDQLLERFDEVKVDQSDADDRLTKLEHAHTRVKTIAAGIALIVSAVTPIILKWLNLT